MKLWFENSYGNKRVIAECGNVQEVSKAIEEFIANCNAKKPKGTKPFVNYYTRIWREGDYLKYDVGSHTEFFLLETDKDVNELYDS